MSVVHSTSGSLAGLARDVEFRRPSLLLDLRLTSDAEKLLIYLKLLPVLTHVRQAYALNAVSKSVGSNPVFKLAATARESRQRY